MAGLSVLFRHSSSVFPTHLDFIVHNPIVGTTRPLYLVGFVPSVLSLSGHLT